tara:strand:+ start:1037 stop:1243 length:207 start_codon:yes stop_codon:yes gene_type:complete
MIITIDADTLAIALAHNKVEKKYEDLNIEYTINNYDEFRSFKYTKEAQKDFDKYYKYFYNIIIENQKK